MPLDAEIQLERCALIRKEKVGELVLILTQEIQIEGNFILARVVRMTIHSMVS